MLRAVVFDLDDTLVDQRSAAAAAVVAWAAEHGVTGVDGAGSDVAGSDLAGSDLAARWAAVSVPLFARWQRREITFAGQRRERVREFLGVTVSDAEADVLFAGYLERYEAGWVAFPDAGPALRRAAAAGLAVAVLTNGDEEQQRRKLARVGLAGDAGVLVASSVLPAGKPDVRAFRHTAALLGVEPGVPGPGSTGSSWPSVLMVGDSLPKDVLAARAAGWDAVLVDRDDAYAGDEAAAGVRRVRSLDELDFQPVRTAR
ncbi:HAD family hydrolase [Actinoplanes sp. NBRC 103695]|uniref:HAD family hydrolase n=1 Tax=Actinoplanes sp. NBRC 103695 TaxID=3032202 RepID=UPI0024A469BE|nr:HAD family hydrolase [Actinoplanes sp. NBRC 103695]GLY95123.1 haloacid dehalogenase [Actinoplanes sp. NBRC 103695]